VIFTGYPLVGGLRLAVEMEKTQSHEKAQKTRRVPTCPLHALLGCIAWNDARH